MLKHSLGLWRIEYLTDLTKARSPVVPVGLLLEAHWENGVRWQSLLFRKRLTAIELEVVDLETWPELGNLEPYMKKMFDRAWQSDVEGGDTPKLGSAALAASFTMHGNLQFVTDKVDVPLDDDTDASFKRLYSWHLGLHDTLNPQLVAPVVQLPRREVPAPKLARTDVKQLLEAA